MFMFSGKSNIILTVSLIVAWLSGFVFFSATLRITATDNETKTDAIIVLTGSKGRIEDGVELLNKQMAQKLFISGVYQKSDLNELKAVFKVFNKHKRENLDHKIYLGHLARDTEGNAWETKLWLSIHDFKTIRLVTSFYHMPRSMLEFQKTLPEIQVVPHPSYPKNLKQNWWSDYKLLSVVFLEYNKYIIKKFIFYFDKIVASTEKNYEKHENEQ